MPVDYPTSNVLNGTFKNTTKIVLTEISRVCGYNPNMRIIFDLFEFPELQIIRGSDKRKAIVKYLPFYSLENAKAEFDKLYNVRLKHNYQIR